MFKQQRLRCYPAPNSLCFLLHEFTTRQKEHLPLKRTIIFYNDVHFFYYSKCYCNSYSIRCANWQKQFFFFFFSKDVLITMKFTGVVSSKSATQKNQIARRNPLADNSCQALKWQNKCLSHFLLLRFLFSLSHYAIESSPEGERKASGSDGVITASSNS